MTFQHQKHAEYAMSQQVPGMHEMQAMTLGHVSEVNQRFYPQRMAQPIIIVANQRPQSLTGFINIMPPQQVIRLCNPIYAS